MPDQEQTVTSYPAAPTRGGSRNAVVPDAEQEIASSPIEDQDVDHSETATPQEAVETPEQDTEQPDAASEQVPFHKHPRFQEILRERDEAKELARMALERFTPAPAPVVPEKDPWDGYVNHQDPATAQWYQQQRVIMQKEAERISRQQMQPINDALDAGRRELAMLKLAQFRSANPDIKPGSAEEGVMAHYVSQGFDLDTAKKLATYDQLKTRLSALEKKQTSIPRKAAAANAQTGAGIPSNSGLPQNRSSWEDRAKDAIRKGGSPADIFNAALGKR